MRSSVVPLYGYEYHQLPVAEWRKADHSHVGVLTNRSAQRHDLGNLRGMRLSSRDRSYREPIEADLPKISVRVLKDVRLKNPSTACTLSRKSNSCTVDELKVRNGIGLSTCTTCDCYATSPGGNSVKTQVRARTFLEVLFAPRDHRKYCRNLG